MNHESNLPPIVPATPAPPVMEGNFVLDPPAQDQPARKTWLHPISGGIILLLDTLFFGGELITFELGLPVLCFLAFVLTTGGVFLTQKLLRKDSFGAAAVKALFGGIVAGIPTSLTGTVVGGLVIALSGWNAWKDRAREVMRAKMGNRD